MGGSLDGLGFWVEIGGMIAFYALFLITAARSMKDGPNRSQVMSFERPEAQEAMRESAARVSARAGALGLAVTRYLPVFQPVSASYGALTEAHPDGAITLDFSGEVQAIGRATLDGLPGALTLSTGGGAAVDRTGDPAFDAVFKLGTRLWDTGGALSHEARRTLVALSCLGARSVALRAGVLTLNFAEGRPHAGLKGKEAERLVGLLRALRVELGRPSRGEGWLIDAARGEQDDGARARAIALLTEIPVTGLGAAAVQAALDAPAEQVRLQAALALKNTLILNQFSAAALEIALQPDPKRALASLEAAGAERALARLLPLGAYNLAAAEALGRVGTVESVPALRPIAEAGLLDTPLKRAARQAILAIQRRLQGAEAGQLSEAGPGAEAGALTVSAGRGQLSEPGREM